MSMDAFIIKDVRIFDGDKVISNGYVHVKNGKTKDLGTNSDNTYLSLNVRIISKPGHTLLPGFIDAHNHCDKGNEAALYQGLRFGVTTIMDLHNEIANCHKSKEISRQQVRVAADFKYAGVAATIDNGWPAPVVTAFDKSPQVLKLFLAHILELKR